MTLICSFVFYNSTTIANKICVGNVYIYAQKLEKVVASESKRKEWFGIR